jgi:hypothetical protein
MLVLRTKSLGEGQANTLQRHTPTLAITALYP